MKVTRRFTKPGQDALASVRYEKRTSRIANPDGSVVFEMNDAEIPVTWSQLATDIMVSKYFRKAGVPQVDAGGQPVRDGEGNVVTGPEKSAKQVVNRLAGCWRYWGEKHGYFDSAEDAQAFYDEIAYMLLHQMCAPNSPQWFNTGLNYAYGITGPAQGHYYCDPQSGEMRKSRDAYSHPQPHACQPYNAPVSTPHGPVAIGKIVNDNLLGLEVYDGTDRGHGTTRVVAVKANGEKPVMRVVLDGGVTVEATGDHLVYVASTSGLSGRWVRVDALERGMKLLRVTRDHDAERMTAAVYLPDLHAASRRERRELEATLTADRPRTLREVPVKRVEPIGVMPVYDIQTESGQYLCNFVVVHNCFIQAVKDDLVGDGGIMDLWTREARLFKYGSGTGSNFSKLRGENEPLSGGGKSSGLMSFLRIGDRAAGAIKSGGTTRRAAKMVCLDLDHPDVELFINWKVREEMKVAAMVEGMKRLPKEQQELARRLGLKLDYDFNGEAYFTVSGQNSNNSVRIPNRFFQAVLEDGDWTLTRRTDGKMSKTVKARELWDQIAYAAWRCADPGVQYDDTINQWHTCPQSGRINASNPCVTGDTRVLTPGGIWRRIDQMIHLPSRVVTNLDAQEIHVTDGAFPTGTKEVYELHTAGGYCVKLTADHKVWTRTRGWVEAQDLTADDEVKLPSRPAAVHEVGEPQDPRFFQLLGLFVSDANADWNSLRLDACVGDPALVETFTRYVSENWGERTYNDDYVNRAMIDGGSEPAPGADGGTLTATLTNRRLMNRLKAFVRYDGPGRRLSDEAFTAGLAAQKHLVRALFTADGVVTGGSIELHSTNLPMLQDVQLLLLGFGVQSALLDFDSALGAQHSALNNEGGAFVSGGLSGRRVPQDVPGLRAGEGGRQRHGDSPPDESRGNAVTRRHGLRIDPGSLRSFGKHVGLLPGRKLEQLADAMTFALSRNGPLEAGNFDRVAALSPLGKRQVFDLTEPATHSFIANGLTVHNCSEYMFLDDTACFAPETRISTPAGLRTVEELYLLQERGQTAYVTTDLHSEHDHRRLTAHRPAVVAKVGEREVFVLTLKDGRSIRATGDHRFLTDEGEWKRLDEISIGKDRLQIRQSGNPVAFTSAKPEVDRWQMLGWLTGDGVFSKGAVALVFGPQEQETARDMAARFNALIAEAAAFGKGYAVPRQCNLSTQASGVLQISSTAESLVTFLQERYGFRQGTATHKDVPAALHRAPDDLKVAYLQGLFSADGCIRKSATEHEVMLASSAPELLRSVQLILCDLGIASRITWCHPAGRKNPQGQLHLYNQQARKFLALAGFPCSGQKCAQASQILDRCFEGAMKNPRPSKVVSIEPDGVATVYDITEPVTHSVIAEGIIAHNCNLASLNVLTFFNPESRQFDLEGYRHAIRLWTVVLEISVLMASFPSEEIAERSYKFRTLGLGYANLGAMLMQAGIPYDSEKGRAICAALTAVLTGESYAASAEMAKELGAFPGFDENKGEMLRVIRNHRRAGYDVSRNEANRRRVGGYEKLEIVPVGIDESQFADSDPMAPRAMLNAARESWDRALTLGERHGYRNAQTTVIAPTGCLVGRSLVSTDRGLMRLDRLGNVNGSRWQNVSFSVLTDGGEREATKFFVNGVEATRRITTGCGYAIQGTLKHRIKVVDASTGKWEWKRFADIEVGDVVPLAMGQMAGQPRPVDLPPLGELYWTCDYTTRVPRTVTPELAEFVGYFMGDGSLHAKGLRLCVANADADVVTRLTRLAKDLFNIDAQTRQCEGYTELAVHSVGLTIWWEACGFDKLPPSAEHSGKGYLPRVPDALLASNDPAVYGAFLRGLFEADGTVIAGVPMWTTAQGDFAEEVRALLLALGMPTSTKHDVSGWGQGTLHVLRLRNASYVATYRDKVGFLGSRKQDLMREAPRHEQAARYDYIHLPADLVEELVPAGGGHPLENAVTLSRRRHGGALTRRSVEALHQETQDPRLAHALGFYYDTVEANEDGGEQMTYDLSVPDNVTYVANGFVSHNTIGLLMDCDTTGVEPDFALVKFKKLAGGGYFKIANQSLAPALRNLGYSDEQIHDVIRYVMGTLTLHDAPHVDYHRLKGFGFTEQELEKIEASLPGVFEISFAFSPWTLGEAIFKRLEIPEGEWQAGGFNLLRRLGFSKKQIDEANDVICGRGTVEGAPHLRDEHLPVFDCANKCGRHGQRFIPVEGHIRMMAAAQPFISGAISKTINLPNEASLEDIKNSYRLSWELGLKANALYRDGSKLSQPLNVKSDEDLEDRTDEEDSDAVDAAKDEVAAEVARAAAAVSASAALGPPDPSLGSDNLAPAHTHTIEKIVERIVERPLRRRLPDTRRAITHKFDVAGHEGYITAGLYDDGQPGEVFIRIAKEGSTIGGLMDTIATLVSVSLQYGVPVESLVRKFEHVRFEPSGMTRNAEIPIAKSLVDYIFRYLAMEFVPGYRAANAPRREKKPQGEKPQAPSQQPQGQAAPASLEDAVSGEMSSKLPASPPSAPKPSSGQKPGNGHGPRIEVDTAKSFGYAGDVQQSPRAGTASDAALEALHHPHGIAPEVGTPPSGPSLRLAIVADPVSQQGSNLQADAPACDVCGSITVRSGTCYKCLNCGNSMGCS